MNGDARLKADSLIPAKLVLGTDAHSRRLQLLILVGKMVKNPPADRQKAAGQRKRCQWRREHAYGRGTRRECKRYAEPNL